MLINDKKYIQQCCNNTSTQRSLENDYFQPNFFEFLTQKFHTNSVPGTNRTPALCHDHSVKAALFCCVNTMYHTCFCIKCVSICDDVHITIVNDDKNHQRTTCLIKTRTKLSNFWVSWQVFYQWRQQLLNESKSFAWFNIDIDSCMDFYSAVAAADIVEY